MSIKVVRYNPEKTYLLNSGEAGTPERMLQESPAIRDFLHVIDTDPSE